MIVGEAGPNTHILEAAEAVDTLGRHSRSADKGQKGQHLGDAALEHYLANSCSAAEEQYRMSQKTCQCSWVRAPYCGDCVR